MGCLNRTAYFNVDINSGVNPFSQLSSSEIFNLGLKIYSNKPDAISIELNGSASACVATNSSPIGALIKLNNNIRGSNVKSYFSGSVGVGTVNASADVVATQYYIVSPNANKVTMEHFKGTFYSGTIGIDAGIGLGVGASWSTPIEGAYIIGINGSAGIGVSATVVSAGATWGQMDFYSNYFK